MELDLNQIAGYVFGPLGALAVLLLVVYGFISGRLVPSYILERERALSQKLEEENSKLNDAVVKGSDERTELKILLAKQGEQLQALREELSVQRRSVGQ